MKNKEKMWLVFGFIVPFAVAIGLFTVRHFYNDLEGLELAVNIISVALTGISIFSLNESYNIKIQNNINSLSVNYGEINTIKSEVNNILNEQKQIIEKITNNTKNCVYDNSTQQAVTNIIVGGVNVDDLLNPNNCTAIFELSKKCSDINNQNNKNMTAIAEKIKDKILVEERDIKSPSGEFINEFFDKAKNISDKDVQDIWSRIFMAETKENGSVSLRTLNILRYITKDEAELCAKIFERTYLECFIPEEIIEDISYGEFSKLIDIGILKGDLNLIMTLKIKSSDKNLLMNKNYFTFLKNSSIKEEVYTFNGKSLTNAGKEIKNALGIQCRDDLFIKYSQIIKDRKCFDLVACCRRDDPKKLDILK